MINDDQISREYVTILLQSFTKGSNANPIFLNIISNVGHHAICGGARTSAFYV
jgi:hypothetical protein